MPKYPVQIFALAWLLLGCNPAWSVELEPVTLQLKWKHQFQFAGYYAAKEKGFYKEAGLDVSIVEAAPGVDPAQEVIAGRAQFGVGTSELILNRYRGATVVVLGVIFQHSPLSLITMTDSGIDNIHKLIDRKVMIEPSSAELFAYLFQEGFTPKAFSLEHHSFDLNDLLTGKTDAMSVYVTDELYTLKQQGRAYTQFSPRMSGIDFYGDNFFTLEAELEQHPQRVKAFREATLRGWRYAMQNPDEIVQLIFDRYSQRHSIDHLQFEAKAMHELMQPELIDPGYMNIGRWQHIAGTYHELGLLPEGFDVAAMLYFPNSDFDLKKLKTTLAYAAVSLLLLSALSVILFRFYRTARINEARLKTMFDYAPLSLIVLDDQNRIQGWNAQAEKTFLWRAEDILGKNASTIVPPAKRREVEEVLADLKTFLPIRYRPKKEVETFASKLARAEDMEPVEIHTEDYASILIGFEGGARAALTVSQVSAGRKNYFWWNIYGSKSSLGWDGENPNLLWRGFREKPNETIIKDPSLMLPETRFASVFPGGHAEGYPDTFYLLFQHVYSAIQAGRSVDAGIVPTFADGYRELLRCEAIQESARQRNWVKVL